MYVQMVAVAVAVAGIVAVVHQVDSICGSLECDAQQEHGRLLASVLVLQSHP